MNYMQYTTQPQINNRQGYNNVSSVGWNNRIRPVSSIEEVRAASIDFDGSTFFFPDLANNKIYTKQINLDGTASLNMYALQEIPVATAQPVVDTSNFVTRQEFENVINQLKEIAASQPKVAETPVNSVIEMKTASSNSEFKF